MCLVCFCGQGFVSSLFSQLTIKGHPSHFALPFLHFSDVIVLLLIILVTIHAIDKININTTMTIWSVSFMLYYIKLPIWCMRNDTIQATVVVYVIEHIAHFQFDSFAMAVTVAMQGRYRRTNTMNPYAINGVIGYSVSSICALNAVFNPSDSSSACRSA